MSENKNPSKCFVAKDTSQSIQSINECFVAKDTSQSINELFTEEQQMNMDKMQELQDKLVTSLKDKGHTCIQILESYPTQTVWCKQDPCKNK